MSHVPTISFSVIFHPRNIQQGVQVMKLITQSSAASCCFLHFSYWWL